MYEPSTNVEVVQTRWHPNSPTDSHLLVLLSDNSIRVYDESSLKNVWRIGPVPNYAALEKNLSYLKGLGDTAVDFDIAPAKIRDETSGGLGGHHDHIDAINSSMNNLSLASKKSHQKQIEWPIVILRGNGTIFVINAGLNSEQPRLQGPLTMIPQQTSNYGDDSCSILVIPTLPPTLVIAENSGKLHHALLIEIAPEDSSFNDTTTLLKNDWDLYVLETIELELGLTESVVVEASTAPIILKRDPVNEQRYFCYHDTGLHGVTIGFTQQLQSYINDEIETDPNLNTKSKAEYILSTKAFNSSKVNPVVGIGVLQSPSGIFAILSSGQVVSLNTVKLSLSAYPEVPVLPSSLNESKNLDRKMPFDQQVKAILTSGIAQPILKLDKTNPPSSQQAFELLISSFKLMRENQFQKHDQVRQLISKRVKILECMKNQQKDDIAQLFESKEMIQEKAYQLADKHEDIMERQQSLQRRAQDVLRLASLRLPIASSSEKEFTEQIKRIKSKTEKLLQDVKQIKLKNEMQKKQIETWENVTEDASKALPAKQEETIKEILVDMTKQIAGLSKDVLKINSIIDV